MTEDRCDVLCLNLVDAERLRANRLDLDSVELAASRARALGDPTRLTIAAALRDGTELCVCDLAWVVERSDKLVSHHLGVLRAAGLVSSRREGKIVFYAITERGASLLGVHLAEEVKA